MLRSARQWGRTFTASVSFVVICVGLSTCLLLCASRLHVVLVQELYRDLPASDTVFLGRPLNALTWPELLRHYLEMVTIEQEEEGMVRLTDQMGLAELCDDLQCENYEELPFKTKVRMLLMNFHLALETRALRHYVDSKQDVLEIVANEKRFEFDRLRKEFNEQQIKMKAEKSMTADATENLQQESSSAVPDASSEPGAGAMGAGSMASKVSDQELKRDEGVLNMAATNAVAGRDLADVARAGFARQHAGETPWQTRAPENPISQMDGANDSSAEEDEEEDEDTGMVVDEDDEDIDNEERASRRQASSSEEGDDQSGDESGDDNMEVDRSRNVLSKNESDEDDEEDHRMSEDEGEDDASNGGCVPISSQNAGVASSAYEKPLSPKKRSAEEDKLAQAFRSAWCELTNIRDYDQEVVNVKGPEGEVPFSIHELYWSVQSFGGSTQLKKWKMAANDMVMRKTGRPCVPVPGRGYGYMPKAWEKWRLSEYEQRYGASNVPPEYKKPAFVATRRAMLLASGLPLSGRRKEGGDLALTKHTKLERAEQQKQQRQQNSSEKAPRARSRTSGARSGSRSGSRSTARSRGSRVSGSLGGGGGGAFGADGVSANDAAVAAQISSPEVIFLLKLLESKTVVRGLTKEEAVIKRAIDHKHRNRLSLHRAKTEPLGADRYKRQYWVLGNDFSVIWVQRPSTMHVLSSGQPHSTKDRVQHAAVEGDMAPGGMSQAGSCRRSEFAVVSSAGEVNRLLKGLDSHGVRENELIESIEMYREEFSAAMGAPIISVVEDAGDKDPVVSAALALTLAGITPLSAANAPKSAETSSVPRAASTQPTGHWERDSDGNRKWVSQPAHARAQSPAIGQATVPPASTSAASSESTDRRTETKGSHQPVVQGANEVGDGANATVVSCAAKFLQTTQPLGDKDEHQSVPAFDFSQGLYSKSTSPQVCNVLSTAMRTSAGQNT